MSVENFKEYTERVAGDPELRKMAGEIGIRDVDAHIGVSKKLGLGDWSKEDMLNFVRETVDNDDLEFQDLSEEELEMIAGGFGSTTAASAAAAAAAAGSGGW